MSAHRPEGDDPTAFRPPEETPTVVSAAYARRVLQLTPGTILGDRYRIVSLIGRGGMGEVYRADDLKMGQTVALKFLSAHGDARRLYDEVRLGRQISHPNVCRLYDVAEVDGQLFITMEFVDGEDLASLIRRVGRLSSEKALAVSRDIIAGVAAAHEKGVIHRDLKPANVMIDGRGRARVTDFGLAVAGVVADGAGTPAYMAPEQLEGGAATEQSDIYALGLIMYELFTGRRAFADDSNIALLARQLRGEFTRPSMVTKDAADVDPVIVRCLEANPEARPSSVDEIARALPGRDALAAAVAAGETPSPEMVAASMERGELSLPAAAGWLALLFALLITYAAVTPWTTAHRRVVIKSPDVLTERAVEILAATSHDLNRVDSAFLFAMDRQWLRRREGASAQPPVLFIWRQSPQSLTPSNYEHRVVPNDPPLVTSGMADVVLEADGRLRSFTIVPPQHIAAAFVERAIDWQPFLNATRITGPFTPAQPQWAAIVDTDRKRAWTTSDGTRIEAASYRGKPVYFDVVKPWATPWRMGGRTEAASVVGTAAFISLVAAFWLLGIVLARRNLRRGQGDRRGAWRIALFVTVASASAWIPLSHHTSDPWDEFTSIFIGIGLSLMTAAGTWVGFVAIEPLIRRRWPRMLISLTRLIAGYFHDPMIGRDLLVGVTVGVLLTVLRALTALLPGGTPFQSVNLALSGVRYLFWFLGAGLVIAIYGPIFGATLLVGLQTLTRRLKVTCVVLVALLAAVLLNDATGTMWARALFGVIASSVALAVVFRFGLVAYGATIFIYLFLRRMPVTPVPDDWYFGRSTFALAIVIGLAVYGFITSIGGKKWLPE